MIEIGFRAKRLPPPQWVVFDSLVDPHRPGTRPWLSLLPDEVEPRILLAERPDRVVWSSLWPDRPRDEVHFELAPDRGDTMLTFTLLTPDHPPDESTSRHLRRRMSTLLFADLRYSYGQ